MKHWAEALLALVILGVLGWVLLLYGGESVPGSGDNEPPPVVVDEEAAARGELVAQAQGCFMCHTVDGSSATGPTFKGLAGSNRPLTTGEFVRADEAYLRRSILDPAAQIVAGYEDTPMPTNFGDLLTDENVDDLVAFLQSLGS